MKKHLDFHVSLMSMDFWKRLVFHHSMLPHCAHLEQYDSPITCHALNILYPMVKSIYSDLNPLYMSHILSIEPKDTPTYILIYTEIQFKLTHES